MNIKFLSLCLIVTSLLSKQTKAQLFNPSETYNRADSLRGTLTPLRTAYDIKKYFLDVDIQEDKKHIIGKNRFVFKATEDFQDLQFDLFENLQIDSIIYQDTKLDFKREFGAVFIQFPKEINKNETDEFTVYYSGQPIEAKRAPWDGGFVWKQDSTGLPWIATACQGLGASSWWPNKDHQADKVEEVTISVTVPNEVMNVSNGRLIATKDISEDRKKFTWKVSYPINNYNISINIADYAHIQEIYEGENGNLDVDYYILKENVDKFEHVQKNVNQTLEAFEYWFGPYPFYRDGFKLVETPYLGMEHQSAVAYGNQYKNGYLGNDRSGTGWGLKWDFIIVHESGHEWFGNNITSKDLADMWIHEAFTTYSEALFIEYFYGKKAGQEYIYGTRKDIINNSPMQGPYGVNQSGSGDMYIKGSVVLNMLRTILEDDAAWRILLRNLNKDFRYATVDYEDIVNYIIQYTNLDLSTFFEQFIKTAEIPTLEVHFTKTGEIQARWLSSVKDFKMPIHIGTDDSPLEKIWLGKEFKTLNIPNITEDNFKIDTFNYYIGLITIP